MVSGLQIIPISFLRTKKQSDNDGAFFCPACRERVSLKGSRWPGTPSIEATILDHFLCCSGHYHVRDPLLFFLNDTNAQMAPGLVVVDRRIDNANVETVYTEDDNERNIHVAHSAIAASQSPKQFVEVVSGPYIPEHEGLQLTFVFGDRTQFSIYESAADTTEGLTLAAYRCLLKSPSRCAA
jgi:hypothetical protein